ncbi:hypothetical protein D3C81_2018650 [compost metagenome]
MLGELQQWPVLQTAVRWHQEAIDRFVATFGVDRFEFFEGHGLGQLERTGVRTAQFSDIGSATEHLADILDQSADVGAFAAAD